MTLDPADPVDHVVETKPHLTAWTLVSSVAVRFIAHDDALIAAGVAFYGFLAVFPALAVLVSLYGMIFDVNGVTQHVEEIASILPEEARPIILDLLTALAKRGPARINTGLLLGFGIGLWSARAGIAALMSGINFAYEVKDDRNILVAVGISIAVTVGAIVFAVLTLAVIAAVPVALSLLQVPHAQATAFLLIRWPLLALIAFASIATIYFAVPHRKGGGPWRRVRRILPGAIAATLIWLPGCSLFSVYVTRIATYDVTYGSLGGPVVFLLWLWLTALVVLIGAEINATWSGLKTPKPRH
ncbi:YihY/virulence factor BrkB family protein [Kaistia dalseonensis]|uniref:Membrane protein n=1 Tax=Kaistia dalseonensis TaxID=410840 RepID=A0ABU0HEC2_9HYPH|nr:YihY/virulence factor BrkB family protein [Kaistia dalseonensis]MCX5497663.1 YihY/virulence factor BrkB family protein [Kaistia dalseonensis]MDQ0440307.1 membrane protein [Kaistia dalseonensis]